MLAELWNRLMHHPAVDLSDSELEGILAEHGAQRWFVYANREWSRRRHVRLPCSWLAGRLSRQAHVVETGCGCGLNLFWLSSLGFERLTGYDIDRPAVAAGREIARRTGRTLEFAVHDARTPPPGAMQGVDALLALNWVYHVPGFDVSGFLASWRPRLAPGGLVVMDVIDSSVGWPGRPPEYHWSLGIQEMERLALAADYRVVASRRIKVPCPRLVVMLQVPGRPSWATGAA